MKFAVLQFPGSNCDQDCVHVLRSVFGYPTRLLWHKEYSVGDADAVIIPGGFSYGDDLSAGRVWGFQLREHLRQRLQAHVERGGLVLGVCNGFQVLVESGIFQPDLAPSERSIALYANASNHYECRWVELSTEDCACAWLVPGERMPVPVAHAEGRFVARDGATLEALRDHRQVALTYACPSWGEDQSEVVYPANPNGSVANIAGICDPTGRVLGLMPHPERNLTPWNHPHWSRRQPPEEPEGLSFYRRMVEVASAALV